MSITLGINLSSQELHKRNLQSLAENNYSIDECIEDANLWFQSLAVEISVHSRGYKLACKKLADEVVRLRATLDERKNDDPNT